MTAKEIKERLRKAAELSPSEVIELMAKQRKKPVELSQKEIEAMMIKPSQERYIYSVRNIAERGVAWTLKDKKGIVLTGDENGNVFLPIWPYKEYAIKCKIDEWKNCELKKLSLDNLVDEMLPDLSKEGIKVSVFIIPNEYTSATVSAEDFLNNLLHECSKYE